MNSILEYLERHALNYIQLEAHRDALNSSSVSEVTEAH